MGRRFLVLSGAFHGLGKNWFAIACTAEWVYENKNDIEETVRRRDDWGSTSMTSWSERCGPEAGKRIMSSAVWSSHRYFYVGLIRENDGGSCAERMQVSWLAQLVENANVHTWTNLTGSWRICVIMLTFHQNVGHVHCRAVEP